jgi:hypothetical protein
LTGDGDPEIQGVNRDAQIHKAILVECVPKDPGSQVLTLLGGLFRPYQGIEQVLTSMRSTRNTMFAFQGLFSAGWTYLSREITCSGYRRG